MLYFVLTFLVTIAFNTTDGARGAKARSIKPLVTVSKGWQTEPGRTCEIYRRDDGTIAERCH